MTNQRIEYKQTGSYVEVELVAEQVDDHQWANDADLRKAISDIVQCAQHWPRFSLTVKHNELEQSDE